MDMMMLIFFAPFVYFVVKILGSFRMMFAPGLRKAPSMCPTLTFHARHTDN